MAQELLVSAAARGSRDLTLVVRLCVEPEEVLAILCKLYKGTEDNQEELLEQTKIIISTYGVWPT